MTEIEVVSFPPEPKPIGFMWWFRNGDSWHAPDLNNGSSYLPSIKNQLLRDIIWAFRNPVGNFVGFVIGFRGVGYVAKGPKPVTLTTGRDVRPPILGWRWAIINGWAPYVSYWGGRIEFYFGWRPSSGGFGIKLVWRQSAFSDQEY